MPMTQSLLLRSRSKRAAAVVLVAAFTLVLSGCEKPVTGKAHGLPSMVLFKTDVVGGYDATEHDPENDQVLFDDKSAVKCITDGSSLAKISGKVYSQSFAKTNDTGFVFLASAARSYAAEDLVNKDIAKWKDSKAADCLKESMKASIGQGNDGGSVDDVKITVDVPPSDYPRSVLRVLHISGTVSSPLGSLNDPTDPTAPTGTPDPTTPDPTVPDPTTPDPSQSSTLDMHGAVALLAWGTVEAEVEWIGTGEDISAETQKRITVTVANRIDPH